MDLRNAIVQLIHFVLEYVDFLQTDLEEGGLAKVSVLCISIVEIGISEVLESIKEVLENKRACKRGQKYLNYIFSFE